ncbi:hypothetical protein RFI_31348, partial [Reticulomyxa filosa]
MPLNPYSITLKQGLEYFKHQLQIRQESMNGEDEFIKLEYNCNKCKPQISSNINENVLLNNIYRYFPHYPNIQVYWAIDCISMVSYKHTIRIERTNIPKNLPIEDNIISSNQKTTFNPLLYECDIHKLKTIQDNILLNKETSDSFLKSLLHEVINNEHLLDLIPEKPRSIGEEAIKQQINYNEKNANELILNENILTILNELKILYHNDIHKQMGYPLELHQICA